MIVAAHNLIYSDDPEATRAFLRDVLEWQFVEHAGSAPGWLIFKTGPSELGVHPTSGAFEGGDYAYDRHHELALMCDDIESTVAELAAKGATSCTLRAKNERVRGRMPSGAAARR